MVLVRCHDPLSQSPSRRRTLEVRVRAREDLALDVLVPDVEIGAGKRARANTRRYIRGQGRLALLGVLVGHLPSPACVAGGCGARRPIR